MSVRFPALIKSAFRRLITTALLLLVTTTAGACAAAQKSYDESVIRARETVLRDNLYHLRKSIDLYTADRGALPQTLDELARAGYFREVPDDPITQRKDWKIVIAEDPNAHGKRGIADVHSAAIGKSSEGSLYSDW